MQVSAQNKDKDLTYAQKAADVNAKVWGDQKPAFDIKTIPAGMEKESAVIIAKYTNVEQSSNSRLKFAFARTTSATRTNRVTTYRERVKINDKAALEDYATLSYQKSLDKTQGFINKTYDKKDNYIGAKIIKADGREIIVNTSEEVLTKNETKDKQGKLAIPGLEVGDILDYYVCKVEIVEDYAAKGGNSNYLFVLRGEYPILNYELSLQYNSKVTVHYISANKAPEFKESTTDNGDKVYNLKMTNLPKYEGQLWTSTLRQYPYIELSANLQTNRGIFFSKKKDISRIDEAVQTYELFFSTGKRYVYTDYKSALKKYYDSAKEFKAAPLDSLMRILYDKWKYNMYIVAVDNDKQVYVGTERNKIRFPNRYAVMEIAHTLFDMEVDFDVLLASSRNSSSLDNVFNEGDLDAMIRINNGSKHLYMCFDDIFTQFNEIPEIYQGEEAIVLSPKKRNFDNFELSHTTIPVTPSKDNYSSSKLMVSLLPSNMQKVKIERTVNEAGALRDNQADLLLTADISPVLKTACFPDVKKENKVKTTKLSIERANANVKAREELADNFKNEISGEFGQDPQNLTDYKVTNVGVTSASPVFSYTGAFEMDNFVKRAGNNYILEAGKLMGAYTKVEDKERQRSVDVYMPAARTFSYDINISIPKGYQVKGFEELNHTSKNDAGLFTVVAGVKGDMLTIKLTKIYNHNFEKVAQWPQLLELMDATYTFNTQKVLFEKI